MNIRMYNVGGVVYTSLESTIYVGKGGCAATEAHRFAEIVTATLTEAAFATHDSSLDRHALTDDQAGDTSTDSGYNARSFMAENKGLANGEFTVATVLVVMYYGLGE